jgi:hypothetical protein
MQKNYAAPHAHPTPLFAPGRTAVHACKKTFPNLSISPPLVRRVDRAGKNRRKRRLKPMRFMMIYKPADTMRMEAGSPPSQEEMAKMGQFIGELASTGVLLATDGLLPTSKGARVKLSQGKATVTDGPFTETKELIAGFAIMQLPSMAEAIELSKRFLAIAGDGESEIRQMYDQPAFPPPKR